MQKYNKKGAVKSAGIEAHGLNPTGVIVMKEIGIDISHHASKKVSEFQGESFDFVITVCDNANEHCPHFPGKATRLHQNFTDPSKKQYDNEDEKLGEFRKVRDEIAAFCESFVKAM